MKCEAIRELLTQYLLGDLSKALASEVHTHLDQCDGCRAAAREIEPTLDLLRDALAAPSQVPQKLSRAHRVRIMSARPKQKQRKAMIPPPEFPGRMGRVADWFGKGHFFLARAAILLVLIGIAAGMFLPAVSSSREKARRTSDMSDLSQIGKSIAMYSMDHDEAMPESLEELKPYIGDGDKSFEKVTTSHEGRRYFYRGKGLTAAGPSDEPIAVDVKEKGGNVLYLDGSVTWMNKEDLEKEILPKFQEGELDGRKEDGMKFGPAAESSKKSPLSRLGGKSKRELLKGRTEELEKQLLSLPQATPAPEVPADPVSPGGGGYSYGDAPEPAAEIVRPVPKPSIGFRPYAVEAGKKTESTQAAVEDTLMAEDATGSGLVVQDSSGFAVPVGGIVDPDLFRRVRPKSARKKQRQATRVYDRAKAVQAEEMVTKSFDVMPTLTEKFADISASINTDDSDGFMEMSSGDIGYESGGDLYWVAPAEDEPEDESGGFGSMGFGPADEKEAPADDGLMVVADDEIQWVAGARGADVATEYSVSGSLGNAPVATGPATPDGKEGGQKDAAFVNDYEANLEKHVKLVALSRTEDVAWNIENYIDSAEDDKTSDEEQRERVEGGEGFWYKSDNMVSHDQGAFILSEDSPHLAAASEGRANRSGEPQSEPDLRDHAFFSERSERDVRYETVRELDVLNTGTSDSDENLYVYSYDPGEDAVFENRAELQKRNEGLKNKFVIQGKPVVKVTAGGSVAGDLEIPQPSEPVPPVDFSSQPAEFDSVAIVKSPVIMKGIYGSRDPGTRGKLLGRYGGSGAAESSVTRSLRFLKDKQSADGSWGGDIENTSVSLLAFLAHGETPASAEFGATTEKAMRKLVESQKSDGRFSDDPEANAKAVHAVSEAYGMTKIPLLKDAAEKGVKTLVAEQGKGDEVSIWQAQAIKAAKMANLDVPELDKSMNNISGKLKESQYAARAHGLQLLGQGAAKETREKLETLKDARFALGGDNLDEMYFITQAKFSQGGEEWHKWNNAFGSDIVKAQTVVKGASKDGKDVGYYDLPGGGDEIYDTALASLMQSVWYRYLPTFKEPEEPAESVSSDHDVEVAIDLTSEEEEKAPEDEGDSPRFKAFGVNPFYRACDRPFSTFAIDVDTAAYTLSRNYMQKGLLPPAESVRTEEFVNFFDYGYRAPERGTFKIHTECAPAPFGRGLHLMKIGVKGRRIGREEKKNATLMFVIDTSGSMNTPDRIELVKKSLRMLIEKLAPQDEVAIIQFGSKARLVLDYTPAAEKERILGVVDSMQTTGSTNLEEGMRLAYEVAARGFTVGAVNRVLVMSDGVANLGTGAAEDILAEVAKYRKQGIYCSVFGFGMGTYNDEMLETLANKGDGTYTFIDSEDEARRVFVDDLSATLNTIAADVKIQVEFNPDMVTRYRQLGYENRQLKKEQFRDDTVDAGEVGSGQSVTALYELDLQRSASFAKATAAREISRQRSASPVIATVRVRYRRTDTGAVEEIERPLRMSELAPSVDDMDCRFRLAACTAEFAEILRASPFVEGSDYEDVARLLRPAALELNTDTRVQELLRMAAGARGMSRAPMGE